MAVNLTTILFHWVSKCLILLAFHFLMKSFTSLVSIQFYISYLGDLRFSWALKLLGLPTVDSH